MKTILITTDFTETSKGAITYVLDFFYDLQAPCKIILLNTYITPRVDTDKIIEANDLAKSEAKDKLSLEREWALSTAKRSDVIIETVAHLGSLENVIPQIIKRHHIDWVAIGKNGGNHVEKIYKILKHNKSMCPLMIVFTERSIP